jgi:cyclopropane fatty-acyl-phospholipid synthase-like methyltransferase
LCKNTDRIATPPNESVDDPATHYDRITSAWRYLLGEDFHFGYFRAQDESLEAATDNLTSLMAESGSIGPDMSVLDVGCGIGNPPRSRRTVRLLNHGYLHQPQWR